MHHRWFLVALLVSLSGCPESSSPDAGIDAPAPRSDGGNGDGGSGDGGSDTSLTDGGSGAMGDCDGDDDCDAGEQCIELVAGGYRVCRGTPMEATACEGDFDDCCESADCERGACYLGPIHAACGGPVRVPTNVCASDECASDTDCTDGNVCAPAGTFAPVAVCTYAACRRDADCSAEAGGHCVVAQNSCCDGPVGLLCSYDSDGCRSDGDCPGGYCSNDGTRARCAAGAPICPL